MKSILFIVLIITSLGIFHPVKAQQIAPQSWCAAELGPEKQAWLENFQQRLYTDPGSAILRGGGLVYVPIKAHVVGDDDGKGYFKLEYLLQAVCELNERFSETNIYFYLLTDVDYIDNTDYWNQDFSAGYQMMNLNNTDGAVNLYFVNGIGSSGGTSYVAGYYAYGPDAIALRNASSAPGNTTITHEMGHYLSLPHTFSGWEYGTPPISDQEQVDGDNCTIAGDGFCDTPPDYAPYPWFCPSEGPFTDPDGTEFYVTDSFYMSYAQDCSEVFSPDQSTAMINYLNSSHPDLINTITPYFPDVTPTVQLGEPEDGAVNVSPSIATFTWQKVENAVGYHVSVSYTTIFNTIAAEDIVTDTFYMTSGLFEDRNYYWKVKPLFEGNTCEGYSEIRTFHSGQIVSGIQSDSQINDMRLFPNPVTESGVLNLEFSANGSELGIRIYNAAGSLVQSQDLGIRSGFISENLSIDDLNAGFYILELQQSDGIRRMRFMVQ